MKKIDQAALYSTQISMTEWFEKLGHRETNNLRLEDNLKRDRLTVLNEIINLPFDRPVNFKAIDLKDLTPNFKKFLKTKGKELCALRLIPNDPTLPKIRTRGSSINDSLIWFNKQKIDPKEYKAEFIPHGDNQKWSTIFIVNSKGIFGEIIKGGHYQLTQGFYDAGEPITFSFDFQKISISEKDKFLEKYLLDVFKRIRVKDLNKQKLLFKRVKAKFAGDFLMGYFETVDTEEFGLWFVDYNRILGNLYNKGKAGSGGKVTGKVRIVKNLVNAKFRKGDILVCPMTSPDYLPLMKKAAAIVTNFGGILSHAAIVARELKIPCITGTKNATEVFKDGQKIEVDGSTGLIKFL